MLLKRSSEEVPLQLNLSTFLFNALIDPSIKFPCIGVARPGNLFPCRHAGDQVSLSERRLPMWIFAC